MVISKKEKNRRIILFIDECKRIIEYFGLYDWRVYFSYDEQTEEYNAYCETNRIISNNEGDNRLIGIFYSTKWLEDKDVKDKEILTSAFHEIMELLLTKLRYFAENISIVISK